MTPSTRQRRPHGDRTRDQILDSAITLIAAGGLTAATQRKVAQHAGVSLASVTYHFRTATDLLDASLSRATSLHVARLEGLRDRALRGELSLVEAHRAAARDSDGAVADSAVVAYELLVGAIRNEHLRPRVDELIAALSSFFEPWIPRPQFSTGVAAACFSLTLFDLARGGSPETAAQIETVFDLFGLSKVVEDHVNPARQQNDPKL
ncbi:TetR/AcrR family transcriptional regulator [Streptomyces sp. DT195]|uniref:TetR/AcrR family transcriptional regulator n=1 Tax=Streptomyces sp. DT195 TaxID=3393419 RepID=UPI003CF4A7B2